MNRTPPHRALAHLAVTLVCSCFGSVACKKAAPEPEPVEETSSAAKPASTLDHQAAVPSALVGKNQSVAPDHWNKAQETVKAMQGERLPAPSRPGKTRTARVPVSPDDPMKGDFTLAQATEGLKGEGPLTAKLQTQAGTLTCELFEDRAPITVANFVGLARGLRPFKHEGKWLTRPGYDGAVFHRIVKGFMIQGGDPSGTGRGEPGYVIPDDVVLTKNNFHRIVDLETC
jgi:peptidyl-prolyl cis-trans isomerase A (cyclophilin A)